LQVDRCVDIGTGSGIIAVCLALETDWKLAASDLGPGALKVAKKNAKVLGAAIQFHEGNLLDPVPDPVGLVVANLPYVDPADQPSCSGNCLRTALGPLRPGSGSGLIHSASDPGSRKEIARLSPGDRGWPGGELCRRAMGIGWRKH